MSKRNRMGRPVETSEIASVSAPESQTPTISVVVPVRNDPTHLEACLNALSATAYSDYEVVVVDDASTDETATVAQDFVVRVITLDQQSGPAEARNQGAKSARGELLLFIDADVCVAPETVGQFVETFKTETEIAAAFGSYDAHPAKINLISQYKNLLHHFVHQRGERNASTFWSGCGAIRRAIFLELNGFNTGFGRPCIEDIELGVRLRKAGHRIFLNPAIQVKHLKRWTLWGWIRTDICDRAVPWTQLILQEKSLPNDLNLRMSQRLSALLSCCLILVLLVGSWFEPFLLTLPLAVVATIVVLDVWPHPAWVRSILSTSAILLTIAGITLLSVRFGLWMLIPIIIAMSVIGLNASLFVFFARTRHVIFAMAVVPLHITYFIYSSAVFGSLLIWKRLSSAFLSTREHIKPTPTTTLDCPMDSEPSILSRPTSRDSETTV